jgi:methylenetetrahydrofolate dehydrogenase (NADP+)/methenyltetrahydrofolate cyclohydrolase
VIGAGELVGKPLIQLLINHKATVSVLNSSTPSMADYTRRADIIISAVGKPGLIQGDMISDGCIVIDAGTSSIGDTTIGDVDIVSVEPKAGLLTPTPGGVGPLTVAKLLENTVIAAEKMLL